MTLGLAVQQWRLADLTTVILELMGNLPIGQESGDRDAPIRMVTHKTLDTNQVEYRTIPPLQVAGDRTITLTVPVVGFADLQTLRGMRDGTYGLPVSWWNDQMVDPIKVVVQTVQGKALAGAIYYVAHVVMQPL